MSIIQERLSTLRAYMIEQNLAAFIIPTEDPHMSEYPSAHFQTRAFISGFHGSAGTVVVTRIKAGLWTDSRYFLEAEEALKGSSIDLFKMNTSGTPTWTTWLGSELNAGETIGCDGACVTVSEFNRLTSELEESNLSLEPVIDPFKFLWLDRPALPSKEVYVLPTRFSGSETRKKIEAVQRAIQDAEGNTHIVSSLADIAWILNLRGSDVPFNPVFLAFLLFENDHLTLFTAEDRLNEETKTLLKDHGVEIAPYEAFDERIGSLTGTVVLDPEQTGIAIQRKLVNVNATVFRSQPSIDMKAIKGPVEQTNLKNAMRRDGVALVRLLIWLENELEKDAVVTELEVSQKLTELRSRGDNYISDSFRSIVGANAHGAVVHYSVSEESSIPLAAPGVFLIDSGGQYLDGTTDITRTVPIVTAPWEAKEDFTLVLKSHIALASLVFPAGWAGQEIDAIARQPLWLARRNYSHGTGHGVGYVLNVHEGPQRIAPSRGSYPLKPGMIVSNEPGVYRENRYGIRIENLMIVQEDQKTEFGAFLRFETISLCPINREMIIVEMLSSGERRWVNAYHDRVYSDLVSSLTESERDWLKRATVAI